MSEDASGAEKARASALQLLGRREHTGRELRDKLAKRGYGKETIEPVLTELAEQGVLDESRFAEAFAHSRVQRGQGPVRIAQEMRERGVPGEQIETALAGLEVDWVELARAARQQRFGTAEPGDRQEAARQARFLQRRGFTAAQVRAAAAINEDEA